MNSSDEAKERHDSGFAWHCSARLQSLFASQDETAKLLERLYSRLTCHMALAAQSGRREATRCDLFQAAIGTRVAAPWFVSSDRCLRWFMGTIAGSAPSADLFRVKYDNGDVRDHVLAEFLWNALFGRKTQQKQRKLRRVLNR